MDRTDLVRLRWRLTGAWLWPSLLTLSVVDAVIIHWLPPAGDSASAVGGWLLGSALMLLAVGLLSPTLGALLRRGRRDMPKSVARNYAGTFLALGVSLAFLTAGLIHQHVIRHDQAAVADAAQRAKAWIGDHAPAQYQQDVEEMNVIAIQPPRFYRLCVPNPAGERYYCVVVDETKPFGSSVSFDGTESNQLLDEGAD